MGAGGHGGLTWRNANDQGQETWVAVWDAPRTTVRRAVTCVDVVGTPLVKCRRQHLAGAQRIETARGTAAFGALQLAGPRSLSQTHVLCIRSFSGHRNLCDGSVNSPIFGMGILRVRAGKPPSRDRLGGGVGGTSVGLRCVPHDRLPPGWGCPAVELGPEPLFFCL